MIHRIARRSRAIAPAIFARVYETPDGYISRDVAGNFWRLIEQEIRITTPPFAQFDHEDLRLSTPDVYGELLVPLLGPIRTKDPEIEVVRRLLDHPDSRRIL